MWNKREGSIILQNSFGEVRTQNNVITVFRRGNQWAIGAILAGGMIVVALPALTNNPEGTATFAIAIFLTIFVAVRRSLTLIRKSTTRFLPGDSAICFDLTAHTVSKMTYKTNALLGPISAHTLTIAREHVARRITTKYPKLWAFTLSEQSVPHHLFVVFNEKDHNLLQSALEQTGISMQHIDKTQRPGPQSYQQPVESSSLPRNL